jgi:hypothetical protein
VRRALLLMSAATCLLAVPASAAPPARNVSADYAGGGVDAGVDGVPALYVSGTAQGGQAASVTVPTLPEERAIQVDLTDGTSRPVLAALVQHTSGDPRGDVELGRLCSGDRTSFRLVAPGRPLSVFLLAGSCPTGPSVPTTGTVQLSFTR